MNSPLMTKDGMLRSACEIPDILGKNRLRKLGFEIPSSKVTARQAVMLNKAKKEACGKKHGESHCTT